MNSCHNPDDIGHIKVTIHRLIVLCYAFIQPFIVIFNIIHMIFFLFSGISCWAALSQRGRQTICTGCRICIWRFCKKGVHSRYPNLSSTGKAKNNHTCPFIMTSGQLFKDCACLSVGVDQRSFFKCINHTT